LLAETIFDLYEQDPKATISLITKEPKRD